FTLLCFVIYLNVGKAGLVNGAVVNYTFAAVYESIVPKAAKGVVDGIDYLVVECKNKVTPARTCAECSKLQFHIAALFVDKVPNLAVELFSAEIKPASSLFCEFFFIHNPGFKTSMIGPWNIGNIITLHATMARKHILNCCA